MAGLNPNAKVFNSTFGTSSWTNNENLKQTEINSMGSSELNPNAKEFAFTGGNVTVDKTTTDPKSALQSQLGSQKGASQKAHNTSRYLSSSSHITRIGGRNYDPHMRVCQSIEELTQMAYKHISTMSPRGMSAFWAALSKLLNQRSNRPHTDSNKNRNEQKQMKQILAYTLKDITTFGCRDLAQTSISLAKIINKAQKRRRPQCGSTVQNVLIGKDSKIKQYIFREIASSSVPILHEFDARSLSNLIYAFGLVEEVVLVEGGSTLFDMLADQVISFNKLDEFWPQALSNTVWAFATAGESNPKLFKRLGDHIITLDSLNEFKPQELKDIVWAYATLDEQHPQLFKKVADHIVELDYLNEFWPQALSNIIWAYATLDEQHPKLFKKIADHIITLDMNQFKPQELSNIFLAYATSDEQHPMVFEKLADHIVRLESLDRFDPQAFSNTLWAFAKAGEQHPQLFKKVADHIVGLSDLNRFDPQAFSNILWALATAGESHPHLFKKISDHIVGLDNLDRYDSQALSNIVWAYATAGESQPQLFKALTDEAIKRQHDFTAQGIANFLWAYATNGQVNEHLFFSLVPSVKANLDKYTAQGLANVAWAYSVANVDAPSVFNNEFINSCKQKEDEFKLEELTQLHQWQLWQEEIKSDVSLSPSLKKKCYEAFTSQGFRPSKFQDNVVSILLLSLKPQEEVLLKSGYRIDAVVEVNGKQIAIEVDGPSHFIGRSRTRTGSTILKHRQVAALDGMPVVSVPYWEWNEHKYDSKKEQYLRDLLV